MRVLYIKFQNKKTGETSVISFKLIPSQEWKPIVSAMRGKSVKIMAVWCTESVVLQ